MPTPSWEPVAHWYDSLIGEHGGYFHQHVIFPQTLKLLDGKPGIKVLDLACGQGAWARYLASKGMIVTGIDESVSLLQAARKYQTPNTTYQIDDARILKTLSGEYFDRITCILAIQNIDPIEGMFTRIGQLLNPNGSFIGVILHPAFRSPRITGWGEDESRKLQFRRVDRYITPMKIPIAMHPGKKQSPVTWTYHRPLSFYVSTLVKAGLCIDAIEEWVSDKQSIGIHAKSENLARSEIPLFLALRARK